MKLFEDGFKEACGADGVYMVLKKEERKKERKKEKEDKPTKTGMWTRTLVCCYTNW